MAILWSGGRQLKPGLPEQMAGNGKSFTTSRLLGLSPAGSLTATLKARRVNLSDKKLSPWTVSERFYSKKYLLHLRLEPDQM